MTDDGGEAKFLRCHAEAGESACLLPLLQQIIETRQTRVLILVAVSLVHSSQQK